MGTLQPNRGGTIGNAQYTGRTKWARAFYDFATDAGAVGTLTLRGDKIPAGARVLSAVIDVTTLVATTAGTGTVALGINSTTDLRTAVVVGTAPAINVTGAVNTASTRATAPITLTADKDVVATIATNAITAGAFTVLVEYLELSTGV